MFLARTGAALLMMFAAAGCGFKPIYAAPEKGGSAATELVSITAVEGPEEIAPLVQRSLQRRIFLPEGVTPQYALSVQVIERAERLAVQIDATVTRYNYKLYGSYTITDNVSGATARGSSQAVTSYNIVSSQYSTLYAETAAKEKAAKLLAEEIERDLLIRFAENNGKLVDDGQILLEPEETDIEFEEPFGEPATRDAIIEPLE